MTSDRKRLVRESWARVEPVSEVAAALFYGRLFELDPGLRHLFRGDMAAHGQRLMQTLGRWVRGLDGLERASVATPGAAVVRDRRHDTVAQALLWTLERGVGEGFTPAVREAWTEAYGLLAAAMQRSAGGVPGLPPGRQASVGARSDAVAAAF